MTGKIFFGNSESKCKMPSKIYIGDGNGEAKEIEKVFVGDGQGIARKVWPISMLPVAYQQVEYIYNSGGTQYFDTGIFPDSDTTVLIDFTLPSGYGRNSHDGMFGYDLYAYISQKQTSSPIRAGYCLGASASFGTMQFGKTPNWDYWNNSSTGIIPSSNTRAQVLFNAPGGKFYKDDVLKLETTNVFDNVPLYYYNSSNTFKPKLYLYAIQYTNSSSTSFSIQIMEEGMRLHHFAVWQNNVAQRDMYPCYRKSDNVIGMYDTVNKVFYTNQGTGNFYKGPNA